MSTLDINSIRDYLIEVGCRVEYPILVNAFKKHLYNQDPNIQSTVRTQFKDYVNRLSTVNVENNMKFITLRPEFRPPSPPPHNGHAKREQVQKKQYPQRSQSPSPPLPAPMMTSSPKRAPQSPSEPAPKSITLKSPPLQPVAVQRPREPSMQPPPPPPLPPVHTRSLPNTQAKNDRLDSPRLPLPLVQQNNNFQSPPPAQPRRQHYQHQSTPRPPPVPQHHRVPAAPVIDKMAISPPPSPPSLISSPASGAILSQSCEQQQGQQNQYFHYRSQSQPVSRQLQQSVDRSTNHPEPHTGSTSRNRDASQQLVLAAAHINSNAANNNNNSNDNKGSISSSSDSAVMMPPPPVPLQQRPSQSSLARQSSSSLQKLDSMPPPRPPPRRRQSTASLYKHSPHKSIDKSLGGRDLQDLARKSFAGRARDHAHRSFSSASTNDLSPFMAKRNSSMKENLNSRDSNLGNLSSSFQSISFNRIKRSRSSHRGEDESDSSSLQPNDPLRRKWNIEASSCNYNNLLLLLREDPKLASCKDIMNGYTALHWASKFGNLEIIRLIAGTFGVSVNIKSSAGQTPLHVAYMFNRMEVVNLLLQSYQAATEVRDHSGKRPMQYWQQPNATITKT